MSLHKSFSDSSTVQPLLFKLKDAATTLGVSATTIRRAIKRGDIKILRNIRHILIPAAELSRWSALDEPKGRSQRHHGLPDDACAREGSDHAV